MKKLWNKFKTTETWEGILFMVESLVALVLATACTIVLKFFGTFYAIGWMAYFINKPKMIIKFIDIYIGGWLQNIAWLIMQSNLFQDYMWNIGGSAELMEDYVTSKEKTSMFNKPRVSISIAIGHAENGEDITQHARGFSRLLNKVFREATHALSAFKRYILLKTFNREEYGVEDKLL